MKFENVNIFDRFLDSRIKQWERICHFVEKKMLNVANDFDSISAMYEFNKLILNSESIRDVENIKYVVYYHTTLSH